MSLATYRRKRRFDSTPEPKGKTARRRQGYSYVIHKHQARNLHYDLRLELDGVLKSWAVPKGPSLDPRDKRLAIQVEDHPLEYARFEGNIPAGQYGAGTAIVWDRGTWEPFDDPHDGLRQGKLKFELRGQKLRGAWVLVASRQGRRARQPQWLLIKVNDSETRSHEKTDVVRDLPRSVASGQSIEETAAGSTSNGKARKAARTSAPPVHRGRAATKAPPNAKRGTKPPSASKPTTRLKSISGGMRADMPESVDVQLASPVTEPPGGDEWLSEIKLDGYRIVCHVADGNAALFSRQHQSWTERFADVAAAAGDLPVAQAILDGEIVVYLPDGRTSFQALQNAMRENHAANLAYVVFDLLYLNGYDLRGAALDDRKRLLAEILAAHKTPHVQYLEHVVGEAPRFNRECCRRELEGIVCKRRARPYLAGRGLDWLKIKCLLRQEFVIGGYTDSTNTDLPFGALLLGYYDQPGRLVYAGRVGTGWQHRTMHELAAQLKPLVQTKSPFATPGERSNGRTHWVRPRLVADVAFSQWTRDGRLRQPSFQGLREDKPAIKVAREVPKDKPLERASQRKRAAPRPAATRATSPPRAKTSRKGALPSDLEQQLKGLTLTHPDRVLYPERGLTKLDLAGYYVQVGEAMLPYAVDRPLSLVRCPHGQGAQCFFQKHHSGSLPDALTGIAVREHNAKQTYVSIKDLAGLLALVQMGVLEIHLWGARADDLERPDWMVFDLDPGTDVSWGQVVEAAVRLRDLLGDLDLRSFVKTTGGKGLHVVAPLDPRADWTEVKQFSKTLAQNMAAAEPARYTTNPSKSQRPGRIFLDYLRNDRGATSVAPYSTRARPGAPVSVPLTWRELFSKLHPEDFSVATVPERLAKSRRDPWPGFFAIHQKLPRTAPEKLHTRK